MIKMLGITGSMGCGKSYACEQIQIVAKERGINVNFISIDHIRRDILGTNKLYQNVREQIIEVCGKENLYDDGTINRAQLGEIIFSDSFKMDRFREIINPAIKAELQKQISKLDGLILVEWALLVEDNLLDVVENVLVVTCSREKQLERLKDSDLSDAQVKNRINYGLSNDQKIEKIKDGKGRLFVFDTTLDPGINQYRTLFEEIIGVQ